MMSDDPYLNYYPWPCTPEMVETPLYGPVTSTTYTSIQAKKAWVLWHRYWDGSAAHVERVYLNEKRAKADYELLTDGIDGKISSSEWQLTELTITG